MTITYTSDSLIIRERERESLDTIVTRLTITIIAVLYIHSQEKVERICSEHRQVHAQYFVTQTTKYGISPPGIHGKL